MAKAEKQHDPNDGYIPFAVRFKAWWEGLDPEALLTKGQEGTSALAIQVDEEEDDRVWTETRLDFCRRLWGGEDEDEVVEPGGAEYSSLLMKPMNLNAEVSAVDLSAGLGGGLRKTCNDIGTYIDGYEIDEELAAAGNELSKKHGMERKAPIRHYDPETLELPARKFSGLLCRERLYQVNNKERFLQTLVESLKPRGHLILTDFVVMKSSDEDDKNVQAWLARAPAGVRLWTPDECRKILVAQGTDIRIFEDETDKFRSILLQGWQRFVTGLTKPDLTRDFINDMMREAEYWLMLIRSLESGKLRYYRFHAIRGVESDIR